MYQEKDTVLYGTQGVCRIEEIAEKNFNGKNRIYYVLKPVFHEGATVFVPLDNEALTSRMRKVLSAEEIRKLILKMPGEQTIWIENDVQRKERYKEILEEGDRVSLIRMIKTLYQHQQKQLVKGKKLHAADERSMKEAERMLYEEFAHVLKIRREQVLPFIMEQIEVDSSGYMDE